MYIYIYIYIHTMWSPGSTDLDLPGSRGELCSPPEQIRVDLGGAPEFHDSHSANRACGQSLYKDGGFQRA